MPVNSLLISETITANGNFVANHFNTCFASVAARPNEKIVKAKNHFHLINGIKPNKVIGPNTIPSKILKEFKTELSESLSDIINVFFNKGICPDFNVIPIYKKGEKVDFNNYRLNPLISNIIKLYEKSIHIRLNNFLRKNKVLFSN